ncbi:MAG: diguanylate cyclase [bacterium]|nr:diguanylate cyclase [bacterium]
MEEEKKNKKNDMNNDDLIPKPNILIVDDKPENLAALEKILEDLDCEIIQAESGNRALEMLLEYKVALIFLDVQMPEMDGFETAELIRGVEDTRDIPIIFVTAYGKEKSFLFKGYESGAVDYISKPIEAYYLKSKAKVFLELYKQKEKLAGMLVTQEEITEKLVKTSGELGQANTQLKDEINKRKSVEQNLKDINRQLETLSRVDPLTGLSNRRDIFEKMEYEIKKVSRTKRNFAILLGSIDGFKEIVKSRGYDEANSEITTLAQLLRDNIRAHDVAARWGEDEFLIFFPETDRETGIITAERIRKEIEATEHITMSFGGAVYDNSQTLEETIKTAHERLARAKESGQNRIDW